MVLSRRIKFLLLFIQTGYILITKRLSVSFRPGKLLIKKRDIITEKVRYMKKEYDFSGGVRGKFYTERKDIEMPVYLDKPVKEFLMKTALKKNTSVERIVNSILKKEMELIKSIADIE